MHTTDTTHTTFYVPVVLNPNSETDRKVLVIRQQAKDACDATMLVRRRYSRARVHAARPQMLTHDQMAALAVSDRVSRVQSDAERRRHKREMRRLNRDLRDLCASVSL